MKAVETCEVKFSNGKTLTLPFRHFCGGTSIKLPMEMADFRKQWALLHGGGVSQLRVGRYSVETIVWPN